MSGFYRAMSGFYGASVAMAVAKLAQPAAVSVESLMSCVAATSRGDACRRTPASRPDPAADSAPWRVGRARQPGTPPAAARRSTSEGNNSDVRQAADSEASALRSVDLLDRDFPTADQQRMDLLVRRYIEQAVTHEWPAMAHQNATLERAPPHMALALRPGPRDDPVPRAAMASMVQWLGSIL